ncbi:MAG: YitT family protein [Clostridia bacterium]|nr:YitT family protein [Clostridia bacterium]
MRKQFFAYVRIILLAVLLAFNYELFIVDNHFAPAGLNGVATMVQYKCGFSIGYMALIINVPLCVLAFFLVDKDFAVKSLVFCVVYSFSFLFLQSLDLERFHYAAEVDTIFPVMIAGLLSGVVYGLGFRVNSSTGGTDIIAKFISKKKPTLNFFWVSFTLNAIVAAASFFVYAKTGENGELIYNYKPVVLCVLYCFISSYSGNLILKGYQSAYKFLIITTHAEEIENEIVKKLRHGATRIHGQGAYSHKDKEVIVCVVNKHQLMDFETLLKKYDDTFAMVEPVSSTVGNFKFIKK